MKVKDKLVNVESLGGVFHIEAEARKDADNALSARINNIITPDGDPSLTEVADARVSGQTTYNTLKSRLDAENEAINSKADVIKNDSYTLSEWELSSQNNLYPSKSDVIQYNDWNKIERKQNYIILDGENVSNLLRFAIFNDSNSKVSSTAPSYSNRPAWYSPINIFTVGHTYNISVQLVSGTYTFTGTSSLDNFIDVRTQADGVLYQSKNSNWVCNKIPEMICFSIGKGVYSNAVFEISILDVTETNPVMHALKDSSAQKLSILFHTDIHANKGAIDAINAYIEENDSIIDEVISGGDMAQYEYSSSKNQYYFDSGLAAKSLCVIGNHDSAVYDSSNNVDWWGKTQKEVYDRYLAPYITSWNVVQPTGAAESGLNYYYKDYSLIRIIFLDAMFWDASQRNWLVDVLADAKTNAMSVLVVAHGTDGKFTGDLNCSWTWVEKPNETGFYSNLRFNGTAVTAVDDFISGGGEFIGWLTGHSHLDRIGYMTDYPMQPVFNMNDSGTKTLDSRAAVFSCTMVVIDRVNKLVKLIRVGCNYDSYLKPKHTLCYNYQTQTLVSAYQVTQNEIKSIETDVDDLKTNLLSKYNKDVLYANNLELGYYSKVNGSKQDNSSSTNYSRTKSLIPADEDTLYVGNVTAIVTCYDKDLNYIGNITIYNRTYKVPRQTTPLGTAYVGLAATNPQYFQLEKVDSGGVQSIEYPYESDNYLHIESCWCNGSGTIASTTNLDLLIIQVKAGERWYVSNSSSYNLLCFDQSGALLESTYETRSPIGKIVTVPTNAKTMCVNLYRNRTKGTSSDMSDYVARLGGKKVLAIGDSITWLDGRQNYGGAEYFSGWQRQLRLAGYDVINAGWSGYPYANGIDIVDGVDYSIYKEIVTKAYDVSGYDFVILFGGTNDVLYNGALGDRPTDYSNRTFDDTKFNGAIGGIVNYIRQNNNNAKIIMASFPKSEAVSRSFANALSRVEEIKYNSMFWSCAYVDIFSELNIQPTYDAFDLNFYDATHPNFLGMQKIGALILNAVKKYCD